MSGAGIEEIEHTADWAIRVSASELESLFERTALGMFSLIGSVAADSKTVSRPITLQAHDLETLLVCWLEELLFLLETENLMLVAARIQIPSPSQLFGMLELLPAAERTKEIKAVTYNELAVRQTPDGFEVAIVFDV
jgi:SHS2 domain-containing protein